MNLLGILPEMILSAAALFLLVGSSIWPGHRRLWLNVAGASLLGAAAVVLHSVGQEGVVLTMVAMDGLGQFFKLILLAGLLLVLWMSSEYHPFLRLSSDHGSSGPSKDQMHWGTYCALLLLSGVGLLLMVSATDFLLIFVSLELVSITSFILTGYLKHQRRSTEAAIKFFLVGSFASALLVYGLSILYGLTGHTQVAFLASEAVFDVPRLPLMVALLFVLAGFGFKMALVPFHMWVPDAYEGAPTPVTAYLSVAPKAAALAVLVRALSHHSDLDLTGVLSLLAALTMTVGNLAALRQTNVKRLLAYSSIAQVGYIMVGFVAAGHLGMASVLTYTLAYLFMNLGAFACVIAVTNETQNEELQGFTGLSIRSLPLALATTVFLLSLTGLPPMIGFIGKFSVFAAAIDEGWIWLAVVGVLNSVVSLYYYFRIVRCMFFESPFRAGKISLTPALTACVGVTLFVTLGAGLFPNALLVWVKSVVP